MFDTNFPEAWSEEYDEWLALVAASIPDEVPDEDLEDWSEEDDLDSLF